MPEIPGFFPVGHGTPLHGVYHAPSCGTVGAAVIAPPLFEERKSAFTALTQLARALAGVGIGTLRFDYRGSGESGGDGGRRRWQHLTEDLEAARNAVRRLSGRDEATLIGVRLSALLALTEAARLRPERIVAIAPILKGATEVRLWRLRSKMRNELSTPDAGTDARAPGNGAAAGTGSNAQGVGEDARVPALDLDGFPVHPGFLDDLQNLDLPSIPAPVGCPTLVVQISHRETAGPDCERLVATLGPKANLACIKALPFWERVENAETSEMQRQVVEFLV